MRAVVANVLSTNFFCAAEIKFKYNSIAIYYSVRYNYGNEPMLLVAIQNHIKLQQSILRLTVGFFVLI